MKTIMYYSDLSDAAQERAVRDMRDSIKYVNHVLGELRHEALNGVYKTLGLVEEQEILDVNVSLRKIVIDFEEIRHKNTFNDVIELSVILTTSDDDNVQDVIERMREHSSVDEQGVRFDKISSIRAIYGGAGLEIVVTSHSSNRFSRDEEYLAQNWVWRTLWDGLWDVHGDLMPVLDGAYDFRKVHEYLTELNPECFEDGQILL